MPPPALPIELTDAIVNYLHADHSALAACTLVCRAWRRAAQHHLLATIVCARGGLERLIPQLEAKDLSSQVEDETCVSDSFAAHVRELWIRGPERGLAVSISVGTMERVLATLPNLHTLHLERVALVHSDALYARDPQIPQARRRYKLRRLDLRMVHQADTQRLTAMLALCAEVQELTLECVYSTGYGYSHDVEEAEGKTRCETLVVSGEDLVALEVRRALRFDALKTCKVELPRSTHVRIVLGMLGAAASSLESLQLHLFSTYPASGAFCMLSRFACNSNTAKQLWNLSARCPGTLSRTCRWCMRTGTVVSLSTSFLCSRTSPRPSAPSSSISTHRVAKSGL